MKQSHIGLIIKEVAREKNFKVTELARKTGRTRQGIYLTFGRSDMSNDEIEEWAKILEVSKEDLFERWKTLGEGEINENTSYLTNHLAAIEAEFRQFTEQYKKVTDQLHSQLETKDRQIEKLMDLLGKLEDVSSYMTARVIPLQPEMAARRA